MDTNEPTPTTNGDETAAGVGRLRASLRAIWASAAPLWGEHAGHIDTRGAVVTQAMLDAACLHRRARVLELACGPGGVGMAAAEIVGPDGAVVLSDFAPEMDSDRRRTSEGCRPDERHDPRGEPRADRLPGGDL